MPKRADHDVNCGTCEVFGDDPMLPPHDASARCESGGRNHCTCSICY